MRRLLVLATTLAVAITASAASAHVVSATVPPSSPTPPTDTQTPSNDQGPQQITESWALAPASGSDSPDAAGNRPDLSYVSDPGGVIKDAVTVFNFGTVPETFRVYATDAFNNDEGQFDLLPRTTKPVDVGTWVTFPQEMLTVPPGKQATIPITIKVPADATPGDHAGAVLASSETTGADAEGNAVSLDRRTGTRMNVRVSGPLTAELTVANVETSYDHALNPLGGSAHVAYRIENRGNVRLSGTVTVSVAGPFGIGEQKVTMPDVPELLPGARVTLTADLSDVAELMFGVTKVRIQPAGIADADTAALSEKKHTTFVPPIPLLSVMLAVVLVLIVWRARRRRHSAGDQALAPTPALLRQDDHDFESQHT